MFKQVIFTEKFIFVFQNYRQNLVEITNLLLNLFQVSDNSSVLGNVQIMKC